MAKTQKKDAWMPFYVGDYLRDTARLTTEEHGAYLLLIMDYWVNGPLPSEAVRLAAIAKLPLAKWKKMHGTIGAFFEERDGTWFHKRIDEEYARAGRIVKIKSAAGKAGALARWGGKNDGTEDGKPDDTPITDPMADAMANASQTGWQNDAPPPPPSPSPVNTESNTTTQSLSDTGRPPLGGGVVDGIGLSEPNPNDPPYIQIIQALDRERVLAFGASQARAWIPANDKTDAKRFLEAGADLELCRDVFRAACLQLAGEKQPPPGTLKFCEKRIANAIASRNRPMPQGTAKPQPGEKFNPVEFIKAQAKERSNP